MAADQALAGLNLQQETCVADHILRSEPFQIFSSSTAVTLQDGLPSVLVL